MLFNVAVIGIFLLIAAFTLICAVIALQKREKMHIANSTKHA